MFRFFTFIIFLGLLVFTNISKSYSNFFMPQNARSDTTSVGKSIPARRIAPVNRTNSINKVTTVGRTTPVNKTQNIAKPKNKFINQNFRNVTLTLNVGSNFYRYTNDKNNPMTLVNES